MSDELLVLVCSVLVPSAALAVICWCVAAYRDLRDDEPAAPAVWDADRQQWRHSVPAEPDRQPGTDELLLATCRHLWHLPDHQTHRTAKGDQ